MRRHGWTRNSNIELRLDDARSTSAVHLALVLAVLRPLRISSLSYCDHPVSILRGDSRF